MLANLDIETEYTLLPEWSKQSAVMLTWPHRETIWASTLTAIDQVFVQVATEIVRRQKVIITHYDDEHQQHIVRLLMASNANLDKIAFYQAICDDIWVRDHGPICTLRNGQPALLDFQFNGWGNKYPSENDNNITLNLARQQAFGATPVQSIDMVLEGGAIEVDGRGTLLTTNSCMLSPSRNPTMSRVDIANRLHELLGIKKILWLENGYLAGDDTDGHIDTLARFINPESICYVQCTDQHDEHFSALAMMEHELTLFTNHRGQSYQLIPLPWPGPRYAKYDGRRLPASYANFLIINHAVLVPLYDDPADAAALAILTDCFPNHEIIGINCLPVIEWYGSLHCMTMQLFSGAVT